MKLVIQIPAWNEEASLPDTLAALPRSLPGFSEVVLLVESAYRGDASRAGWTTEALFGEIVTVYENKDGWAWVQLSRDGYVGYVPSEGLVPDFVPPTHRVSALRTYVYPQPDGQVPPLALLSVAWAAGEAAGALRARGPGAD